MAASEPKFQRGDRIFSAKRLWSLVKGNEVRTLSVDALTPILDVWIWNNGTPNEILSGKVPDEERHHERVESANIHYPIIVSKFVLDDSDDFYDEIRDHGGQYDILDGIHRLVKHVKLNRSEIKVIFATKDQIEASRSQ